MKSRQSGGTVLGLFILWIAGCCLFLSLFYGVYQGLEEINKLKAEQTFVSGMIHLRAVYDGAHSQLNQKGEEIPTWELATSGEVDQVMAALADQNGEVIGLVTQPGQTSQLMTWQRHQGGQWVAKPSLTKLVGTTWNIHFGTKNGPPRRHFFLIKNFVRDGHPAAGLPEIWHRVNE